MITFRFKDSNGNKEDVEVTLKEIADNMNEFAYEKLCEKQCNCKDEDLKDCECYMKVEDYNIAEVGEYLQ